MNKSSIFDKNSKYKGNIKTNKYFFQKKHKYMCNMHMK